ncbi:MAG: hypothetical protein P4L69_00030 [Desulfosporosinus sp.]|nr:hypothetical protein [Desulfosporosinus sp.]
MSVNIIFYGLSSKNMIEEQWETYPTDFRDIPSAKRTAFRCLGLLLKYASLVKAITKVDVVAQGASLSEEELLDVAESVYRTTSSISGIPQRTLSVLPSNYP